MIRAERFSSTFEAATFALLLCTVALTPCPAGAALPSRFPMAAKSCEFSNGEIVASLPTRSAPNRSGLIMVRARDARGAALFDAIFPVRPSSAEALLLFADPLDSKLAQRIHSVRCDLLSQDESSPVGDTCSRNGGYWSTVTDNGPTVSLRSVELHSGSMSLNVVVDWVALGSIPIKRLDSHNLVLRNNDRTLINKRLFGFAPQSVVLQAPRGTASSMPLLLGFSSSSGGFEPQSTFCLPREAL